jgi:hypothetical protein
MRRNQEPRQDSGCARKTLDIAGGWSQLELHGKAKQPTVQLDIQSGIRAAVATGFSGVPKPPQFRIPQDDLPCGIPELWDGGDSGCYTQDAIFTAQ